MCQLFRDVVLFGYFSFFHLSLLLYVLFVIFQRNDCELGYKFRVKIFGHGDCDCVVSSIMLDQADHPIFISCFYVLATSTIFWL